MRGFASNKLQRSFEALQIGPIKAFNNKTDVELFQMILEKLLEGLGNVKPNVNKVFHESFEKHSNWVKNFEKEFFSESGGLVTYENLRFPLLGRKPVSYALETFTFYPFFGILDLIFLLNQIFLPPLDTAWSINKNCRPKNNDSYFARNLTGSSKLVCAKQTELLETRLLQFSETAQSFSLPNWYGRSLFPIAYLRGELGYARLRNIPSVTLFNTKREIKTSVLTAIKGKTQLRFVELDLKNGYTVIFRALANLNTPKTKSLPDLENHWAVTIAQFRESVETLSERAVDLSNDINWQKGVSLLKQWSNDQIKALCKKQWYQALNGESCFKADHNLDRLRNKLAINENSIKPMYYLVNEVFKGMPVFSLLSRFQRDLNRKDEIRLPTENYSWPTTILSKGQRGLAKAKSKQTPKKGISLMSRLFASCEVILVMLMVLSLTKSQYRLLPVSYKGNGFLLIGEWHDDEINKMLARINLEFNNYAKEFMNENWELEFKNLV